RVPDPRGAAHVGGEVQRVPAAAVALRDGAPGPVRVRALPDHVARPARRRGGADQPIETIDRGEGDMTDRGADSQADRLVLPYLAGDNDLERTLLGDLNEMERAGSRPGSVEILAQVDRAAA